MCCGSCFLVCRGRVLVWHPHTRKAHVVASGLYYPDGVVVSDDGSYLLVVETDALRVVKLWLTGDKVGMGHSLLQIYAAMQAVPAPELFNSWSLTGAACAATQLGRTAANGCLTCPVMCPCLGLDQERQRWSSTTCHWFRQGCSSPVVVASKVTISRTAGGAALKARPSPLP